MAPVLSRSVLHPLHNNLVAAIPTPPSHRIWMKSGATSIASSPVCLVASRPQAVTLAGVAMERLRT